MYDYKNLRASQITDFFPGCVPCICHDDTKKIYKVPRYSVRFRYGTTVYGRRGRIISEIIVECDYCGAYKKYDVEEFDVYEKDINW